MSRFRCRKKDAGLVHVGFGQHKHDLLFHSRIESRVNHNSGHDHNSTKNKIDNIEVSVIWKMRSIGSVVKREAL